MKLAVSAVILILTGTGVIWAYRAAPILPSFPEHPPFAHTGGFGEPTCHQCHFDNRLNDRMGSLRLDGFPAVYAPGSDYVLTVALTRPGLARGGFQFAIRFSDGEMSGEQAGQISPLDHRSNAARAPNDVWYVFQTLRGTEPTRPDSSEWTVAWTAPAGGNVVLHIAGNAGNGDNSEFGDHVYVIDTASRPLRD